MHFSNYFFVFQIFLVRKLCAEDILDPEAVAVLPEYEENDWRIIGGSAAQDGQYPYQISIRDQSLQHRCGGSIISPEWILTAAHCIHQNHPSKLTIVVGTNYLNRGGDRYRVAQLIPHEQYNPQNTANDIGVIRVASRINYNSMVKPIGLASSPTQAGATCILSGWGLTSFPSQSIPNSLQQVQLIAVSTDECRRALQGHIDNTNVCTYVRPGVGACQGDSGGPLVSNGEQVGVVSWGEPCAKGKPDVFAAVAAFRHWIRGKTGV